MTESSAGHAPDASLFSGIIRGRLGKVKREAFDVAMGKGESWTTKVLNGESGIRLEDVPRFLDALGLKAVEKSKVCVDAKLAAAIEEIAKRAITERNLLTEDDPE